MKYKKSDSAFEQKIYDEMYIVVKNMLDEGVTIDLENLPSKLEKEKRYVELVLRRLVEEGFVKEVVE